MKMRVNLSKMYVDENIRQAVNRVLNSSRYIKGQELENFERDFADVCGTRYAVGVSSGTSAILLSLMALGIGAGDEVMVPSLTFIATASPARFLGAELVFADIDPETYTLDPADVEKKITPRTRAIIPVHLYGHPCNMDIINGLAKKHNFYVIEDACQAHGAAYKGKMTGSLGDIACFSFFPSKNVTVLGDGGMITTDNPELVKKVSMLRDQGRTQKYLHEILGLNFRLSEIHAAIGREQLRHLQEWNGQRRKNAAQYRALLNRPGIVTPVEREWAKHVYHMYVIRVKRRDELASYLNENGIETGIHYPVPVHRQPCLKSDVRLPVTEERVDEILSLPMHPFLSEDEVDYVAATVRSFVEG
jgi:dTDP-4-amino-4,6-dideoxygalactose transaminase